MSTTHQRDAMNSSIARRNSRVTDTLYTVVLLLPWAALISMLFWGPTRR